MAYQINITNSIQDEVKRIALELVENAMSDCESTELSNHEKIHSVRKGCKRLRALLRIVRPNIDSTYKLENVFFRDLARTLSEERDRKVLIESLKELKEHPNNKIIEDDISSTLEKLSKDDKAIDSTQLIANFYEEISKRKENIPKWELDKNGFAALKGGLAKTYRRGRIAMRVAHQNPTTENYHQWRKRVKYHYYHLELIEQIWPCIMHPFVEETHRLSEYLGKDHDLCLLENEISQKNKFNFSDQVKDTILSTIAIEKNKLREEIKILGSKVYTELPSQLVNRLAGYWNSYKN